MVLVCGTLVYSKGDEKQSAKLHAELEATAAEEGEAAPSVLMPGQLSLCPIVLEVLSVRSLLTLPSNMH